MTAPLSVGTNGTVAAWFVPAFANYRTPKLTEATASGALAIALYLTGDGFRAEVNENTVTDERLGSREVFEAPGDITNQLEIEYVYNLASPANDQARIIIPRGTQGFVMSRSTYNADLALAVAQIVDVYPVTAGVQRKPAKGRNAIHSMAQKMFVSGEVARDVPIIA